jgi:hypothetical protein
MKEYWRLHSSHSTVNKVQVESMLRSSPRPSTAAHISPTGRLGRQRDVCLDRVRYIHVN